MGQYGLGAGAGGADMLQEVLARKLQEQQMLAQQRNMREQRALQARGQDITLAGQQAEQDRYNTVQQQRAEATAAKRESDHAQAGLQAAMQGSFNAAGTDDPNGAKATRDALRVAMRAGGADTRDIPQEPVAKAPKLYAVTVTGPKGEPVHKLVTEAQLQAGVREYRTPQKPDKPAAPQIFYDADGKARALQFGPNGFTEVPLPQGVTGKTHPKPAGKTLEQIRAEHAAMTAGNADGKKNAGGGGLFDVVKGLFSGGESSAPTAGSAPNGPAVGDRRTINGQAAMWDGHGWLPADN